MKRASEKRENMKRKQKDKTHLRSEAKNNSEKVRVIKKPRDLAQKKVY